MAVLVVLSTPALAADKSAPTGEALKQTVSGKTVILNTAMGGIPITYNPDGTMSGRARDLAALAGRDRDSGRWWVADDQLCQQWHIWLDRQAFCFRIRIDGRTVYWRRNDGASGTATFASR